MADAKIPAPILPLIRDIQIVANKWFAQNVQQWPALFVALRGFRNGAIYGAKIRAPHALVTILLYGKGNLRQKLFRVLLLTWQHALNLGRFVFAYKLALAALAKFSAAKWGDQQQQQGSEATAEYRSWHPLVAASIIAHFAFGDRRDGVSEQINLYLLSRVVYALGRLLFTKFCSRLLGHGTFRDTIKKINTFPLFASLVWGVGLWLFENHGWSLQRSLLRSMEEIYRDYPREWAGKGL